MVVDDNVIPFPGPPGRSGRNAGEFDAADQAAAVAAMIRQWALANDLGAGPSAEWGGPVWIRPQLLRRRSARVAYVVRVDLDGAKPPIWRRLRLASDLGLPELHRVLQVAMGWTDSHLHQFRAGPVRKDHRVQGFLTPSDLAEGEIDGVPEAEVRLDQVLSKPGHRLFYTYDFGDGWDHTIVLEKVEPWPEGGPTARCLTGRRACPPEDCGGVHGYQELLDALAGRIDPADAEWTAEHLAWLPDGFDPADLDLEAVNAELELPPFPDLELWHPAVTGLLGRAFASVPELDPLLRRALAVRPDLDDAAVAELTARYRTLLRLVGEGVNLTAAGYLPPRLVETVFAACGFEREWIGKGNREDLTVPVLRLRHSATALGLLRLSKGRLTLTRPGAKAAQDPRAMLGHLRNRIPIGRDFEQDAGLLALLLRAAGEGRHRALDELCGGLGWRSRSGEDAAWGWARPTLDVLAQLVGRRAGPQQLAAAARALLARG